MGKNASVLPAWSGEDLLAHNTNWRAPLGGKVDRSSDQSETENEEKVGYTQSTADDGPEHLENDFDRAWDGITQTMANASRYDKSGQPIATGLAQAWWMVTARGLIAGMLGVIVLLWSQCSLAVVASFFCAYVMVDFVFSTTLVGGERSTRQPRSLLVLGGITGFAFGSLSSVLPEITLQVFVVALSAWAVVAGSLKINYTFRFTEEMVGRWILAQDGVLSVIFGLLVATLSFAATRSASVCIGTFGVIFSGLLLNLASVLHRTGEERLRGHLRLVSSLDRR